MAGYSKYYKQQKQVSYDSGNTWENLNEYQKGELIENYSTDCGYIGQLERWINSGYTCDGYNKYNIEVEQTSSDGVTWVSTGESRRGSLIETHSIDCGYIPPSGQSDYLTFVSLDDNTYTWFSDNNSNCEISYSIDGGLTWTEPSSNFTTPVISTGNTVKFKGNKKFGGRFRSSGAFNAEGNAMSLFYNDNFSNQKNIPSEGSLVYLFSGCTGLINAENLVLPATTLTLSCYFGMFFGCSSLVTAPDLPATTLTDNCYGLMFVNCTSLITAPELPSTTLADGCYAQMFLGCTSLTTAPSILPATTLKNRCYAGMFSQCSGLTEAPIISGTVLADDCCNCMFGNCSSLVTAPDLPAMYLAKNCYTDMFTHCASLTTAPSILPATILAVSCYNSMFNDCPKLTTAPELPATELVSWCYNRMFNHCSLLNYVKAMFLTQPSSSGNYLSSWLSNVSPTGTFVMNSAATWNPENYRGSVVPTGWTIQTASS